MAQEAEAKRVIEEKKERLYQSLFGNDPLMTNDVVKTPISADTIQIVDNGMLDTKPNLVNDLDPLLGLNISNFNDRTQKQSRLVQNIGMGYQTDVSLNIAFTKGDNLLISSNNDAKSIQSVLYEQQISNPPHEKHFLNREKREYSTLLKMEELQLLSMFVFMYILYMLCT